MSNTSYKRSECLLSTCTSLANHLDLQMLQDRPGSEIYDENTPVTRLPHRTGIEVAEELGGRMLIHYRRLVDVHRRKATSAVLEGRDIETFVTPTPYTPEEAVSALNLPFPTQFRTHAVLLDPKLIPKLQGPRRVKFGTGLEYILPDGYPKEALTSPWERVVS